MSKQHSITAIIYDKRGRPISIGQNSYIKTHTTQARYAHQCGEPYKQMLHAEIHAITRCKDLSKAYKIKVFRYGSDSLPKLAKPCRICMAAIAATPIKVIEWTS